MKQIFPFTPKRHNDIIRGNFSLDVTLNNPCFQRNEFSFCIQNISINLLSNFNIYLIYEITHFLEQNKLALKQKPNRSCSGSQYLVKTFWFAKKDFRCNFLRTLFCFEKCTGRSLIQKPFPNASNFWDNISLESTRN